MHIDKMREVWNICKANAEQVDNGKPVVAVAVAVAVDKDKGSQVALKWAVDNLLAKGQTVTLVHVKTKHSSNPNMSMETYAKEIFLSFRCLCSRKDVQCNGVVLEEESHCNSSVVSRAINEFLAQNSVEKMVLSAPVRSAFGRFRTHDIHTNVLKGAPDFCTVYVISKGKVSSCRNAVRNAPGGAASFRHPAHGKPDAAIPPMHNGMKGESMSRCSFDERDSIRSPFTRRGPNGKSHGELSLPETDISFVGSGRPGTDRILPSLYEEMESQRSSRLLEEPGCFERRSFEIMRTPYRPVDGHAAMGSEYSHHHPPENGASSQQPPQTMDGMEAEMRRLKLELKQTMDMYSTACREALTAKQKAGELHRWKIEEEIRLQEARLAEEAALAMAEKEKAKCKAALEAAEAAQRIAEMESQRRINTEKKALKEAEERKKTMNSFGHNDIRYRRYTIEEIEAATEYFSAGRKIGEGGYGPVYECHLDHTQVAIKVLRPDAAQGQSQFQQEIEVLSCIRHPNMVLLLGACPEYGCLVYEYLANGSLEDRLFRRGNTPALPWQLRLRIAAEIGTGLLFLHQTKPEPLVHRDLKPANILLDRNYVSKISDVGLARLVPPSVADSVTQYRLTSTAGTFCYIDPEYQQTGMLGIKSDIYSLGVLLLQIVTGKPPMGLTHHVQRAIDKGSFKEMLDPEVQDWPLEEALNFAKLALKCAELRRKDRPDLGAVVLPELERLRELAEGNMSQSILGATTSSTQKNACATSLSDQGDTSQTTESQATSSHATSQSSHPDN